MDGINKGDNVEISFPAYPETNINSKIYRTGNVINPANRNFEIQFRISNNDGVLKPNMLAIIKINDYTTEKAFVVPSIIVKTRQHIITYQIRFFLIQGIYL